VCWRMPAAPVSWPNERRPSWKHKARSSRVTAGPPRPFTLS
jgi:hypothetical protein